MNRVAFADDEEDDEEEDEEEDGPSLGSTEAINSVEISILAADVHRPVAGSKAIGTENCRRSSTDLGFVVE